MRNERGVITILTLVTILFMLAFLLSTFIIVANRRQAQAEIKTETEKIYGEDVENIDQVYEEYFAGEGEAIPINTAEDLFKIGTNEYVAANNTIYKCTPDANYILANNIAFTVADYQSEYSNLFKNVDYTDIETTTEQIANQTTDYSTPSASGEAYTAPGTGTYKLEVWGASGGGGAKGGYAVGTITLNQGDTLYACVGGQGSSSNTYGTNSRWHKRRSNWYERRRPEAVELRTSV